MDVQLHNFIFNFPEFSEEHLEHPSLGEEAVNIGLWQPLLESVRPFLAKEIKRLGLPTDGKSEMELIHDVVSFQE